MVPEVGSSPGAPRSPAPELGMLGLAEQSFLPFPLSVPLWGRIPSFSFFLSPEGGHLLLNDQTPEEFPGTWPW